MACSFQGIKTLLFALLTGKHQVLAVLKTCDIVKHVSTDAQILKIKIAKFTSVGNNSGLLSTKILFWFLSDSPLNLLFVGFDDLSHRQENICSKFKNYASSIFAQIINLKNILTIHY